MLQALYAVDKKAARYHCRVFNRLVLIRIQL
jgi:hypothetical protein